MVAVTDRLVQRVELDGVAPDRAVHRLDQAGKRLLVHATPPSLGPRDNR